MSKLTECFLGGIRVCHCSVFLDFKQADITTMPISVDVRIPLSSLGVPADALKPAGATTPLSGVGYILSLGCRSNVGPSVVGSIVVLMVVSMFCFESSPASYFIMHGDLPYLPYRLEANLNTPVGVPCFYGLGVPLLGVPLPLHQPVVVNGVNRGEFTLSERNKAGSVVHVSSLAGRFCLAGEPACRSRITARNQ